LIEKIIIILFFLSNVETDPRLIVINDAIIIVKICQKFFLVYLYKWAL